MTMLLLNVWWLVTIHYDTINKEEMYLLCRNEYMYMNCINLRALKVCSTARSKMVFKRFVLVTTFVFCFSEQKAPLKKEGCRQIVDNITRLCIPTVCSAYLSVYLPRRYMDIFCLMYLVELLDT